MAKRTLNTECCRCLVAEYDLRIEFFFELQRLQSSPFSKADNNSGNRVNLTRVTAVGCCFALEGHTHGSAYDTARKTKQETLSVCLDLFYHFLCR